MNQHFEFRIQAGDAGERLDAFLAAQLGGLSRMRIANLLAARACLVNAEPKPAGYHLRDGDLIELQLTDDVPTGMIAEAIPLETCYEDAHLIVVVKPSGMLVHPTRNTKTGTLLNALTYHLNRLPIADCRLPIDLIKDRSQQSDETPVLSSDNSASAPKEISATAENSQSAIRNPQFAIIRPGLVHRLDRATSGLMVIAKTQRALSILTTHFHKRKVEKRYRALVEGVVTAETGTILAPIGHDENRKPPRWIMEDGKSAETKFRVLERLPSATLLEFEPVTGRTNQLRIHAAYIGHPIVGDDLYGSGGRSQGPVKNNSLTDHRPPLTDHRPPTTDHRLCLHASRLAFHHPADGRWMEFESPLPEAIQEILRQLKEA